MVFARWLVWCGYNCSLVAFVSSFSYFSFHVLILMVAFAYALLNFSHADKLFWLIDYDG